jgi:hypothetical protein
LERRKILNTEYYIIIYKKIKTITEEENVHDAHDDLPGLPEGDPVEAPAHVAQQQHQHARDPRLLQKPLQINFFETFSIQENAIF